MFLNIRSQKKGQIHKEWFC